MVGWDKFQHYKADRPGWIKNYVSLLDKVEYRNLSDVSKANLHGLFLLAARTGNRIPGDPAHVAAMIGANRPVRFDSLVSAGFIRPFRKMQDISESFTVEIDREIEKELEKETEKPQVAPDGARGVVSGERSVEKSDERAAVRAVLQGCERVTGRALKLTDGRDRKVRARLREGYTVEQLVRAMENATADPFYRGDNDRGKRYDRPETVFKTAEAVEMHLESGADPAHKQALADLIEKEGR